MKFKKIKWRDSRMYLTQELKDSNWDVCEIESIGFVIYEDKKVIVLAGDLFEENVRRTLVIPKENVIK